MYTFNTSRFGKY